MAQSYLNHTSKNNDVATEIAFMSKESKYVARTREYCFVPIAIETLGPICE